MSSTTSRILMVEDDPDQAGLFSLVLSNDGREIITASNAEAALARLVECPAALLLVDWDLPGMKGDALITAVKAQYPETRTILFSNHIHVDQAATACGADGWFRKMDNIDQLQAMIADLLHEGARR